MAAAIATTTCTALFPKRPEGVVKVTWQKKPLDNFVALARSSLDERGLAN